MHLPGNRQAPKSAASEQLPQASRLPIHDHQLAGHFRLALALVRIGVANIQVLEMEAVEGTPDIWVVVDADHHLALAPSHEVGHPLVLLEGEVHAIAGGLPVRRVHVEEGVRSIVALRAGEPGQVLDIGTGEALPCGGQILLDAQQVDGRSGGSGTERLPRDLATEGVLLQVEEACSTLDVGQGFRARHLLPLEDLAGAERPFELAHELLEVVLDNAVEGDQVTVEIVQHLHRGGLGTHEVQRGTACEDFDIAFMRGKEGDQAVGQAAFATHPGNDWRGHRHASLYCMDKQVLGSPRFVHKAEAAAGLAGMVCGFGGPAGC